MKNKALFILLILNSYLAVSQIPIIIKFKPEYNIIADDSIVNELTSIPDSSTFVGIGDTEFCIKFPGGDAALLNI